MDKGLNEKVVLVTRPRHQAGGFIQLLKDRGATVQSFPSIEIQAVDLTEVELKKLVELNDYDLLIFISANAVNYTVNQLKQFGFKSPSVVTKVAVIGSATYTEASAAGITVSLQPAEGYNSEALLKLSGLQEEQIKSKRILIVRGKGGLDGLGNTLMERGATVSYLEVYRRIIPENDSGISRQTLSKQWQETGINVITVTSNEALSNLYDMLEAPGRNAMLNTDLIVPSQRCYKLSQDLGFHSVTIAKSAINQHMLDAFDRLPDGNIES